MDSLLLPAILAGSRTRGQFFMTAICTHVYIHVPPGSSTPSQLSSAGAESARADFTSTASLCGSTIAGSVFIGTQGTRFVCYLSAYIDHGSGTSHVCSPWIMAQVHEIFKSLRSAQSPRNTKKIREQAFIRSFCQG